MNQALVDQVARAVLYEGYILYPYRASANKNRRRFTFGRVYPEVYSLAENGAEPCLMQTQCLVESESPHDTLEVTVRFLHPMSRDVGSLPAPLRKLPPPDDPDFFQIVPELEIEGRHYPSWQEAVERTVHLPVAPLSQRVRTPLKMTFAFPASREIEPIFDGGHNIAGVIVRRQEAVAGFVALAVEAVGATAFKITVGIGNQSEVPAAVLGDANEIMMRTLALTHTVLRAEGGCFVSLIDPPAFHVEAVATCRNIGAWPILVGDEEKHDRDTMISSPIILYDYPKIAPESPGDLFDSGEIDEILTLRILTMTDEEKREMRGVDDQARRILERTESLPGEHLLRMHGVMRETNAPAADPFGEAFFNPATRPQTVSINGVSLQKGDRVRVRPKGRADVMDMALAGRMAVIESIEQDAENKVHLALVLEDDPGMDLGLQRLPGHRFFYGADEVEPLERE